MLKEFRDFINRGNVIDLAVGVIIGGAFNKIISSLVNDLIMPVVGIILGGIDFTNLEITIPNFLGGSSAAHLRYGNFIQNVVDFLIVAFCVFIFIRIINKFTAKKEAEAATEPTTDEKILTVLEEIRDQRKK
ncbi:large-conductance mechanosensitive channel protein MscL [Candidatus Saccharibacteria bacterium]|nr:large-conductance mechanosensitive channel protein MscL [Candidatus Saccharibacteria bacterium]MBB1531638.1 large-conductance mechanosensitive channel protein MscL [Candidatus Saccharibacteria bacterium]MBB1532029.1 large-conductance mechanosensitive channel protein MscL [Candidatus Saccharibacteria bacterium]MBF1037507.1 large-conductance mechanosensitive channel protein MscL [Candidatus Nanosynbacter sp.]MBI1146550.1 large-conductance mechanosensitive channel protein MscL [Candidatus Sacch